MKPGMLYQLPSDRSGLEIRMHRKQTRIETNEGILPRAQNPRAPDRAC